MGWPWGWEQAKMDFLRFLFLYNTYKAHIPIVSFSHWCCSRISLLLHRSDFHHWIWGPDSKDTVGQGFTPRIIELSLNWKELILSIFIFQLVTIIIVIELKYIDFWSIFIFQLVTIIYSIIGIPLFFLFLQHLGWTIN